MDAWKKILPDWKVFFILCTLYTKNSRTKEMIIKTKPANNTNQNKRTRRMGCFKEGIQNGGVRKVITTVVSIPARNIKKT